MRMNTTIASAIKRAETTLADPVLAVQFLADQLHLDKPSGVIFFCSDEYNPEVLASEFNKHFQCQVVGCTTAGEIGSRYQENGIIAVGFSADKFCLHSRLIKSMATFDSAEAQSMARSIESELEFSESFNSEEMFGFLLLDGLSAKEESVTALIHSAISSIALVGGSAGDNLKFQETRIFSDGAFHQEAGVFILIESKLPFQTFKLQHFEPSETEIVITEASPATRTVLEIDGGPAAQEYAELLGLQADELTPQVFSKYPVMLQIGEEWYVRSIQKVNPDGSLTFFCAIDEGLVLTIAKGVGFVETLEAKVAELQSDFSTILCTLGCDCILRRLEIQETKETQKVEEALRPLNFSGFSTFGEQYGSVHVNQTLTGVVLGEQ